MPSSASSVRTTRPPEAVAGAGLGRTLDIEALFRAHSRMVAAIGFRILGRSSEVEDLVQDVFLDACRDQDSIRNPEAIRGWLAVCTIRRARRRLRTRRLKRVLGLDQALDYDQVADPGASPARRALLARLYEVLDRVPIEQRLAWSLRHVEGEDLESVARLCGCSLATAKRRIAAAGRLITEALA
jgi:RNA polymerase sigma-70 factor (ECF subfamily)